MTDYYVFRAKNPLIYCKCNYSLNDFIGENGVPSSNLDKASIITTFSAKEETEKRYKDVLNLGFEILPINYKFKWECEIQKQLI